MSDTVKLRTATIQDADLLLEWRNDPKTRKASHNTDEVQRDEHISWLTKTLNNEVIAKLFQICSPALDGRGLGGG